MGIVSFAQNREDVRLARVLTEPSGFYIDIGAADPTRHSVTRHFSDRGWHGINVEPRTALAEALRAARPRDTTLDVAVGRTAGEVTFYELERPELGEVSTVEPARAAEMVKAGMALRERRVEMITLADLCARYAPPRIDLLSIDVEGVEADVIASGDWRRHRPRVVVVEGIDSVTHAPTHGAWEPMLLAAGYLFAADDGINRFYVTGDEPELVEPLARPVSYLDHYQPHEYLAEIARVQEAARAATDATPAAAGTGRLADRLVADARGGQAEAMWAGYEALREQVIRMRQRLDAHERQLEGRVSAGGLAAMPGLAGPDGIGPFWLALAARGTRLSRRYPRQATWVKECLYGMRERWRRLRG